MPEDIIIVLDVYCKTCQNEETATLTAHPAEINLGIPGSTIRARAQVRECRVCRRALVAAP